MNRVIYIFFISLFLINCTSNTIIEKPKNLVPKEQMVDLMTDMFLASGGEHIKNIHLKRNVNYFPLVHNKYQIDSLQYKESVHYYISKIDDYDDIIKKVDIRLRALRKQYEADRKVQDSLNLVKRDSLKNLKIKKVVE